MRRQSKFLVIFFSMFWVLCTSMETTYGASANMSSIASNITTSLSLLPGLLTALAYLVGMVLGLVGVLKIKDHVENPEKTPLHHGAIRLLTGGALFALPIIFEAMHNTMGIAGTAVGSPELQSVSFHVT